MADNLALRKLQLETEAAQRLRDSLAEALGDDAQLIADMIDGETKLFPMLDWAAQELAATEGEKEGVEIALTKLKERLGRHCARAEKLRNAMETAMGVAEITSHRAPCATLSIRATPPRVEVPDTMELPEDFIKWTAAPDKKAIGAALKDGQAVQGAFLSNQPPALSVRFT